jgi:hypothetical protein
LTLIYKGQNIGYTESRFETRFSLACGETVIRSRSYRGYVVDENQSVGTLFGLEKKMVLCSPESFTGAGSRGVIVPQEKVYFTKKVSGHASTWVVAGDSDRVRSHLFQVDPGLGVLKDNGLLQSKLFLCYPHAVTSYCVPDSLPGRTGTEEAIRILSSAAVRSFLSPAQGGTSNSCTRSPKLSPRRGFHRRAPRPNPEHRMI